MSAGIDGDDAFEAMVRASWPPRRALPHSEQGNDGAASAAVDEQGKAARVSGGSCSRSVGVVLSSQRQGEGPAASEDGHSLAGNGYSGRGLVPAEGSPQRLRPPTMDKDEERGDDGDGNVKRRDSSEKLKQEKNKHSLGAQEGQTEPSDGLDGQQHKHPRKIQPDRVNASGMMIARSAAPSTRRHRGKIQGGSMEADPANPNSYSSVSKGMQSSNNGSSLPSRGRNEEESSGKTRSAREGAAHAVASATTAVVASARRNTTFGPPSKGGKSRSASKTGGGGGGPSFGRQAAAIHVQSLFRGHKGRTCAAAEGRKRARRLAAEREAREYQQRPRVGGRISRPKGPSTYGF